jgi:cell division septation protein DedD
MLDRHRSPSFNARDRNLSSILETITDDGPARLETHGQNPSGESRHTSLTGKAYPQPNDKLDRDKAARPVRAPLKRAPKQRSWRRELAIASFTGSAAIIALIVLYAPWRTESPAQSSTDAQRVNESIADLKTIRATLKLLSEHIDALSTEINRTVRQLDRRLTESPKMSPQRLSALDPGSERMEGLEYQLASLTSRLEALEYELVAPLSDDRSERLGKEDANAGVPDVQNVESKGVSEASSTAALPLKLGPGDQDSNAAAADGVAQEPTTKPAVEGPAMNPPELAQRDASHAETLESGAYEPMSKTAGVTFALDLPEPAQKTVSAPPESEPDTTLRQGSDSLHPTSDDLSNQDAIPVNPSPPKSDGEKTVNDSDAPRSETTNTDEMGAGQQWAINLIALSSRSKAQELQRDYIAKGLDVELIHLGASRSLGKLFGLRIPGFASREEAVAYAESVKQKLGIRDVWIYKY